MRRPVVASKKPNSTGFDTNASLEYEIRTCVVPGWHNEPESEVFTLVSGGHHGTTGCERRTAGAKFSCGPAASAASRRQTAPV